MRVNDISVSRLHATIKFKDNSFVLKDKVSKFGTLVLIRKTLPIPPNTVQAVQVGRSLINVCVQKCKRVVYKQGKQLEMMLSGMDEKERLDQKNLRKLYGSMKHAEEYIRKQ